MDYSIQLIDTDNKPVLTQAICEKKFTKYNELTIRINYKKNFIKN